MDNIKVIAEFFLVSLALSFTFFSPIAGSKLTGNGFIRLISNLSIGALTIALIINIVSGGSPTSVPNVIKIISLIGLIITTLHHQDDKSKLMWAIYLIISSSLIYSIFLLSNENLLKFSFLLSSSFLLGIITYSMTLGHWYLVVPKLSEAPLILAAKITWIILLFKFVLSSISLVENLGFFEEQTMLGSGYAFNWMLLLMRSLFGYVVIFGMSLFNWRLVKMRSIQSSTGVLYAMTFFIFIGELISTYMFFNYGLLI